MNKITVLIFAIIFAGHCTSNGIVEKLESPSGTSSTNDKLYTFLSPTHAIASMGAFVSASCTAAGINLADCACNEWAQAGNLKRSSSSKFVAWLSTASNDMRCRLQGLTGTNCAQPSANVSWVRPDGLTTVAGWPTIYSGLSLNSAINLTHQNITINSGSVWTGTSPNGLSTTQDCLGWGTTGTATVGDLNQTSANWTQANTNSCSGSSNFIYCFAIP